MTRESHPLPTAVTDASGRCWTREDNEYVSIDGLRSPLSEIDAVSAPDDVDALRWLFVTHRYGEARERTRRFAAEGRLTYLPAGSRDNPVAMVCLDGQVVAQASIAGAVEPVHDGSYFAVRAMRPTAAS